MTKFAVSLVLALVVGHAVAEAEEVLQPLDDKTRCVLTCKEALIYAKSKDLHSLFGKIADNGRDRVSLMPTEGPLDQVEDIDDPEQPDGFLEKNFPHLDVILEKFDEMLIGTQLERRPVEVTSEPRNKPVGQGELLVFDVAIPGVEDADWNTKGNYGWKTYSKLRFLKHEGRVYWIPFGW